MRRAVGILSTVIVPVFMATIALAADPYEPTGQGRTAGMTGGYMGEHTMTGRITDLDKNTGEVKVNAEGQELQLHFPKTALESFNKGDQVTVSLGIKAAGSTAGTRGPAPGMPATPPGMPNPRDPSSRY
jgi:hypothetical protein